jgi:hypothetical protein
MGIRSHGDAERPCEPKVSQFEIVLFVDEKVLRFEVSVQDSVGMTVQEAGGELLCEFLQKRMCEW